MGLWLRTAVSYVLVTIGAVLLVEAVLIGVYTPRVIGDKLNEQSVLTDVRGEAAGVAVKLSLQWSARGGPASGAPRLSTRSGSCLSAVKNGPLLVVLGMDGTVQDSSYPGCLPVRGRASGLPGAGDDPAGGSGIGSGAGGDRVAWARCPIVQVPSGAGGGAVPGSPADLLAIPGARQVGTLYEQRTAVPAGTGDRWAAAGPLVLPGVVVLVAAVPVGLFFGFASMRRPVRRLRRLAATTQALAGGDLTHRIPVSGRDELSQLEGDVNRMAERLSAAMARERVLAEGQARTAERARIARELHDSVSQDLFSLRVLAGGVARALPGDSPVRPQLRQMESTALTATREMQAMLLHLRPAALLDGALAGALENLARTYRDRVGITVHTRLSDTGFSAGWEDALLRIAQEAFANAVRHGDPTEVTVTLLPDLLRVQDNGCGFDPDGEASGMGLALMRERAAEIGADFTVTTSPGAGTTVEVRLP